MKAFFGGVPTEADVRALNERWPALKDGDELSHEEVEAVVKQERGSNRYRSITTAWRRDLLRANNIDLAPIPGVGFRCLLPEERISVSIKGFQSGVRKTMRSVKRSAYVRTSDAILRGKQDLMRRFGAAIYAQSADMAREIEPPAPPKQSPRLPGGLGAE